MANLLYIHSILRWLVVISIFLSIFIAWRGYKKDLVFDRSSNFIRHWTATFGHVQLIVGMLLAFKSPYFTYFWLNMADAWNNFQSVFYGLLHPSTMLLSITILTIGSAKSKRKELDRDKFRTMFIYYSIAAFLIFMAIPWPFSPLSSRALIPIY